jgi:hypothetical protein
MNQKKPAFVLKEFEPQKDKTTNDAVVTLASLSMDAGKEAQFKKDTIGIQILLFIIIIISTSISTYSNYVHRTRSTRRFQKTEKRNRV